MRRQYLYIIFILSTGIWGCMVDPPPPDTGGTLVYKQALAFFEALDTHVSREKKKNAIGSRVQGFPYLRTNRFLTRVKHHLETAEQKETWVRHLAEYSIAARRSEIKTLSRAAVESMGRLSGPAGENPRQELLGRLRHYAMHMLKVDRNAPGFYDRLIPAVKSPDDYSTAMRVLGLYPLAYGPILFFTKKAYARMEVQHGKDPGQLAVAGSLVRFEPAPAPARDIAFIRAIFFGAGTDSLGVYQFSDEELKQIAMYFAPVYIQDTAGGKDRPGAVIWDRGRVTVNPDAPAVYYYFSYALSGRKPMLQINYVIWYPERQGPDVPWYEEGDLDGFNFRVTLSAKGRPVMVDIIHNCGCYHFFVPDKRLARSLKPMATETGNQVPVWMPEEFPGQRIALRVSSGWHQIENIGTEEEIPSAVIYDLIPYPVLESLPAGPDAHESIFNEDGIVKGSERLEPYFLFPAGIPEVGAMRQRTRQPTRLIGREHFDNPLILENHFDFIDLDTGRTKPRE